MYCYALPRGARRAGGRGGGSGRTRGVTGGEKKHEGEGTKTEGREGEAKKGWKSSTRNKNLRERAGERKGVKGLVGEKERTGPREGYERKKEGK